MKLLLFNYSLLCCCLLAGGCGGPNTGTRSRNIEYSTTNVVTNILVTNQGHLPLYHYTITDIIENIFDAFAGTTPLFSTTNWTTNVIAYTFTNISAIFSNFSGCLFTIPIPAGTTRRMNAMISGFSNQYAYNWTNAPFFSLRGTFPNQETNRVTINVSYDEMWAFGIFRLSGDIIPAAVPTGIGNGQTFFVDVLTKPSLSNVTNFAYGIWGSIPLSQSNYVWNSPETMILSGSLQWGNTNAQGYFSNRFVIPVSPTSRIFLSGIQGTTNADGSISVSYSFETIEIPAGNISNYTAVLDWNPVVFSSNSILQIAVDISAATNSSGIQKIDINRLNLNGYGWGGEVGDFWLSGTPAEIFGGYLEFFSSGSITNTAPWIWH